MGFAVVDELAHRWSATLRPAAGAAQRAEACFQGQSVQLLQPQLYMNLSGQAVTALEREIAPDHLIVVHDDVDLRCGTVRIKCGGGSGGHRGIESMTQNYGSQFIRVRVGVGRPLNGQDTATFVLSPFAADERELIDAAIDRASVAVECILQHGAERAMNLFNTRKDDAVSGSPTRRT